MFFLITNRVMMEEIFSSEKWFIISSILTPVGYVIQDVVADAMTVEAVETNKSRNNKTTASKRDEHLPLQLYGRFSIIFGSLLVGLLNVYAFSGIKNMEKTEILQAYSDIYFLALFIPLLSVSGVILSNIFKKKFSINLKGDIKNNKLDIKIFWGSIFFVFFGYIIW